MLNVLNSLDVLFHLARHRCHCWVVKLGETALVHWQNSALLYRHGLDRRDDIGLRPVVVEEQSFPLRPCAAVQAPRFHRLRRYAAGGMFRFLLDAYQMDGMFPYLLSAEGRYSPHGGVVQTQELCYWNVASVLNELPSPLKQWEWHALFR